MNITEEMIKRNEKIKKELEEYCEKHECVNPDGSLQIGTMLYFLGFKIIEQEMRNEKLEETIDMLVKKIDALIEHNLNLHESLHETHKSLRKLEDDCEKLKKRIDELDKKNYEYPTRL